MLIVCKIYIELRLVSSTVVDWCVWLMFWLFDAVWNDNFIPFENSSRSGLLKIHFLRYVSNNVCLSWLSLCSSHVKTCFLTGYFWCNGCWQIKSLWHFPSYVYLDAVLRQGTNIVCTGPYSWLEWNGLLVSSLQSLDMRSIELVLNFLARLWVHDQLYCICCILAEHWSFGSVICSVWRIYHLFHSRISCHLWLNNVTAEPVVPFLETGWVSAIALHHWDLHH